MIRIRRRVVVAALVLAVGLLAPIVGSAAPPPGGSSDSNHPDADDECATGVICNNAALTRLASLAKPVVEGVEHRMTTARGIASTRSGGMVQWSRRVRTVELAMATVALGVPGSFVETGVNTGGTAVLMLLVLKFFSPPGDKREFWGADSFEGLPAVDDKDKKVGGKGLLGFKTFHAGRKGAFATSRQAFEENLRRHQVFFGDDVPDDDVPGGGPPGAAAPTVVHILHGWFIDTLFSAPIAKISFLRLDGDMYVSTIQALDALYHKLSVGGFIYIDDYGSYAGCRNAVEEYRAKHRITTPIVRIMEEKGGFEGVWWQKEEEPVLLLASAEDS